MEFDKTILNELLQQGVKSLNLSLSSNQQEKLLAYLESLNKWNQIYNLTSIRDPKEMVAKHILDSLSIATKIKGERIIDVGTGGGLPGIPLAIYFPEKQFVLLDSDGKKTRFLTQTVFELGLKNVTIEKSRVEAYIPDVLFDMVLTRAFSDLQEMLQKTHHLCSNTGLFMAMKGQVLEEEIESMDEGFKVQEIISLYVPGLNAERHGILIKQIGKNQ